MVGTTDLVSRDEFHPSSDIRRKFVKLLCRYFLWNFCVYVIIIICFSFAFLQKSKKITVRNKLQDDKRWSCVKINKQLNERLYNTYTKEVPS